MKKIIIVIAFLLALCPLVSYTNVFAVEEEEHNADFMVYEHYKFCGSPKQDNALIKKIPEIIPTITSSIYSAVLVIVPLIMIIMGSIDLIRSIMSQNEDEIKKGKTNFLKRMLIGVITFIVVLMVKFFVSAMADNKIASTKIIHCIDCFISNECGTVEVSPAEYDDKGFKKNTN